MVSGEQFVASCVYASNFQADRQILWEEILYAQNHFARGVLPWIIMGDFNETLASSKHSRGSTLANATGMRNFQSLIADCELADLAYVGPQFTWWNNQEENPIGKKLDKALVNAVWSQLFPYSFASFETCGVSDHCRCSVTLDTASSVVRLPFKYFTYLADLPEFPDTV